MTTKIPVVVVLVLSFSRICFAEADTTGQRLKIISSMVTNYCVDCHNSVDTTAGLNLEGFPADEVKLKEHWDSSQWEHMVRRLNGRQMPPVTANRPDELTYLKTLSAMESILDEAALASPQPGRTDSIRRLNRTEYRNAIRDLLELDVDVTDLLPADELSHGFDNVTVGELSPALLNRYITAAERISRMAVGGLQRSPGGITIRLPADQSQEAHVAGLPLGTRGGTLLTHHFPADGDYEIQLLLMRDRDEFVEGLKSPHKLDVLLDRELIQQFTITPSKGGKDYQRDDSLIDRHLKKRFQVTAGPHAIGVTFPQTAMSLSEIKRQPFDASFNKHRHPRQSPALFQVSIVGPFDPQGPGDTPSRRRIFTTRTQDDLEDARQLLKPLMRRAYRRPITEADIDVPMRFYQERCEMDGFEAGIESALAIVLVNPHFLFRSENEPADAVAGVAYKITDMQLASRLSFFLWSSLPDDELLLLAEENRLHLPDVLKTQVERMLKDKRSESLVTNFAAQWLYLRNLQSFKPDMRLFPDFDDNLRQALRRETELLFNSVVYEDRSVLDLLRTDTTYLNERLAKHYGIPHVYGSQFRPVKVEQSSHRGGLLRHGSILAVTSYATRTSPTIRGNWILENILGTPAPPPPPNVPTLKDKQASAEVSIRERLAEHRANPACASCHNLMDPVGFSLENFDAVGRWRNFDDGQPVDATGALPDGQPVASLEDLEAGILQRPEMFAATLTGKLLTFALGRGVELSDGAAIRTIVRQAAKDDYRFSSLILAIVSSTPFQMRQTP